MKYHFGCADHILEGYINCDSHSWPGVDQVIDLTEPDLEYGVTEVFSNAFFEHLYVKDRAAHLEAIISALTPEGFICYLGLPWFPGIAKAYLMKQPGTVDPTKPFDLYNAWRYTHGAPEEADYSYLGQLHKGLFDKNTLEDIFRRVGVQSSAIFSYTYPGEPKDVHVTAGVYIVDGYVNRYEVIDRATKYLKQWNGKYLNHDSLIFL